MFAQADVGRSCRRIGDERGGDGIGVVSMKLSAEKVSGGYRLNGTQILDHQPGDADVLIVYAKTGVNDDDKPSRGITTF